MAAITDYTRKTDPHGRPTCTNSAFERPQGNDTRAQHGLRTGCEYPLARWIVEDTTRNWLIPEFTWRYGLVRCKGQIEVLTTVRPIQERYDSLWNLWIDPSRRIIVSTDAVIEGVPALEIVAAMASRPIPTFG